jgi:hypothetical protein
MIHQRRSSIDEPAPSAWLEPVTEILDRVGARWALIGALAALRYRNVTRDRKGFINGGRRAVLERLCSTCIAEPDELVHVWADLAAQPGTTGA